ncbi:MAG TPA: hypothetical protein VF307_07340 [Candidatus Nanopelagicaceae bacterium]
MSKDTNSHEAIVDLVKQAKHRPLPRSTKALVVVVIFAMVFTGGLAYGKHKATASTGAGLSLAGLSAGGLGGGGIGGFRNRNGRATAGSTAGTGSGANFSGGSTGSGTTGSSATTPTDVAGTIVSITKTTVVIQTLAGDKQTFPLAANARVRLSTPATLTSVQPGDIVTIRPDTSNAARTITVVK